ncbi:unnamed protein product [Phytomonas sp. EM1]|nr:unnamed protein product [Phytomonas sp. EM1]|eukprot:CCW63997.1 unnamed protein product [Phytomonas sp. isolate EM1]
MSLGALLGLDTYLPGTPQEMVKPIDAFPYSICDCGSTFEAGDADKRLKDKLRHDNAVRRRQQPSCFEEACAYGNLPMVMYMCQQGGINVATRHALYESQDATPLMWAAFRGHLSIVRFLVDQEAAVNACNSLGHTALHWAIIAGKFDVVRFLLDHGADPWQRDNQGFDAAFVAVQNDQLPSLVMLTEDSIAAGVLRLEGGRYVQSEPAKGDGERENCQFYYLNPDLRDTAGHGLMHWAAWRNSATTCQYLVEYWGYEVNVRDSQGRTPLLWAAREGFAEVIEYLLSCGADTDVVDEDGYTALHYTKSRGHPEATYVLETHPCGGKRYPNSSCCVELPATDEKDAKSAASHLKTDPLVEIQTGRKASTCDTVAYQSVLILDDHTVPSKCHAKNSYATVRERRAAGTLRMMRFHPMFALRALAGVVYIVFFYLFFHFVYPAFSYFLIWIYLLKNFLWDYLTPQRIQGSRPAPKRENGFFSAHVIVSSIAGSLRGTWVFRQREPSNLFAILTLLGLQVMAWHSLGFTPFLPCMSTLSNSDANLRSKIQNDPQTLKVVDTIVQDVHQYFGGYTLGYFFGSSLSRMIMTVLPLFLGLTITNMVLTKCLSMRSVDKKCEGGTWQTSPLWRILQRRAYRWLHPRSYLMERHAQIPLRSFYCPERDVVIRRYDGYSILLDCPVGESNHLPFVLSITFLALFEGLILSWGLQQAIMYTGAIARMDRAWHESITIAFKDASSIEKYVREERNFIATDPQNIPLLSVCIFEALWKWAKILMKLFVYGLPGNQPPRLSLLESKIELMSMPFYERFPKEAYFFFLYFTPTLSNTFGVCLFHTSLITFALSAYIAIRQWHGVCRGVTQMELANPLAPGIAQDGALVSIFPPNPRESMQAMIDPDEERYYAAVDPSKERKASDLFSGHSIYSNGRDVCANILHFILGIQDKSWRDAMAVSENNTPIKRVLE